MGYGSLGNCFTGSTGLRIVSYYFSVTCDRIGWSSVCHFLLDMLLLVPVAKALMFDC